MFFMSEKPLLLYITCPGRSGSTLLDMILGNHSKIVSTGEVGNLRLAFAKNEMCTCGSELQECPFWLAVAKVGASRLGRHDPLALMKELETALYPYEIGQLSNLFARAFMISGLSLPWTISRKLIGRPHAIAIKNSLFWYDCIREAHNKPIVVDSTKDPRRLKGLYFAHEKNRYKIIRIFRDGRAISASSMRREGIPMAEAAKRWKEYNRRIDWALNGVPGKLIHNVSYEDICLNPETTISGICEFLEIDYEVDMIRLKKESHHNIGGNPMRFRVDEQEVVLDERWKNELTQSDLAVFSKIAGAMNRKHGYSSE